MPLIKEGRVVVDPWRHLGDEEALGDDEAATVSLQRWSRDREALYRRNGPIGLRLPNDVTPSTLATDVARFALIVLSFPRFTDGRAYSQARLLRSRFGFQGELRASGNVLRDQLLFMRRCGFDAFEIDDHAPVAEWLAAFHEFDLFYQPAEDGSSAIMHRRLYPRGFV
jgi:uncharacterized protein (DUF934 family)